MKNEKDISEKLPRGDGMTVPEGYFSDFAHKMAESLPPMPFEQPKAPRAPQTAWQRVRPYVYMAAMFAGVWCMLRMFTSILGSPQAAEPSAELARALQNEAFVSEYVMPDVSQYDLVDQLMADGVDLSQLSDFSAYEDEEYDDELDYYYYGSEYDYYYDDYDFGGDAEQASASDNT